MKSNRTRPDTYLLFAQKPQKQDSSEKPIRLSILIALMAGANNLLLLLLFFGVKLLYLFVV